jgi:hypothetical protein
MDLSSSLIDSPPSAKSPHVTATLRGKLDEHGEAHGLRLGGLGTADNCSIGKTGTRRLFDEEPSPFSHLHANHSHADGGNPLDLNLTFDHSGAAENSNTHLHSETRLPPAHGRKRTSAERRQQESPRTPYRNNNLFDSCSNNLQMMQISSPNTMSPHSFLTMDGRFVHSNNPFSSPRMDEESVTPRPAVQTYTSPLSDSCQVPTFPMSLPESNHNIGGGTILPRRHPHAARNSPLNGGFPDHRFSFTGSPIPELDAMDTADDDNNNDSALSLLKVRKFARHDDITASSRLEFQNIRLSIDSNMSTSSIADDDVSPTDVFSFAFSTTDHTNAPPTPIKSRRPPPIPYTRIQRQEPTTPSRTIRPRRARGRIDDDSSTLDVHQSARAAAQTSRFYGDYDIIGELGAGGFGQVFKVLSRLDGCMYAIKAARRKANGRADRDRMLKEVSAVGGLCLASYVYHICSSFSRRTHTHRSTPSPHSRTKRTRPLFTLFGTTKPGWRMTDCTYKQSYAQAH